MYDMQLKLFVFTLQLFHSRAREYKCAHTHTRTHTHTHTHTQDTCTTAGIPNHGVHFGVILLVQIFAKHPSLQEQLLHVLNESERQIVGHHGQKDDGQDRQPHFSRSLRTAPVTPILRQSAAGTCLQRCRRNYTVNTQCFLYKLDVLCENGGQSAFQRRGEVCSKVGLK